MLKNIKYIEPSGIEKRSFEIITEMLGNKKLDPVNEPIIKRVIHTTADFDYADTLIIKNNAVKCGIEAIRSGCSIVTDTNMALSGINKQKLSYFGGKGFCYMNDEEIKARSKALNVTRASLCMDKASENEEIKIYAVGNAPTALIRLYELIIQKKIEPALVVGVPVGFVNVVESKELFKDLTIPYIISEGRKGGSTVAAAIINALLYMEEDI